VGTKNHPIEDMDDHPLVDRVRRSVEDTRSSREGMSFEEADMWWTMLVGKCALVVLGIADAVAHGCQSLVEVDQID
jgi:hypothetical protein